MVPSALVKDLVDEGGRFLGQLKQDGFVVHEAFWVYDPEIDEWRLYLMTNPSDRGGASLYKTARQSLHKAQPQSFDVDSVVISYPTDPRAAAVQRFQARRPAGVATNVRGQSIEGIYFDRAFIYPHASGGTPAP